MNSTFGTVSIIMPAYNCAKYISNAIDTILGQTYSDWELLIQDDFSTDNTKEIVLCAYGFDNRIKYACNESNSGAAITRNNALRRVKGKWIAFLDSDDLWEPTKLESQLRFMVINKYKFSYTGYQEIDPSGEELGIYISGPKKISKYGMYLYCWPGCLTVIYDRNYIGDIQIANIKSNNDYAIWLMICQKADCYYLNSVLAKYRRGRVGSISNRKLTALIRSLFVMWNNAMEFNIIVSYFLTILNILFGIYKKIIYVSHIPQIHNKMNL